MLYVLIMYFNSVSVLYSPFFVLFVLYSYCIMYSNVRLSHNKKNTYLLTSYLQSSANCLTMSSDVLKHTRDGQTNNTQQHTVLCIHTALVAVVYTADCALQTVRLKLSDLHYCVVKTLDTH